MQRTISTLIRTSGGGLKVSDRETINCDDDHTGLEKIFVKLKKAGATMVLILAEDDSILRHWTLPAEVPTEKIPAA